MGSPKVSVIIASYNHEKYVVESIKSVLQQTYQDFEIVITDDGSNDATVDQIRNIRDSRIRLFCFDINQGACAAMNNCLRHASCEYIAVLNSDDIWMPTKLELQIDYLQRNPDVAAVFSNALFVDERGQDFSRHERPEFFNVFEQQNRSQGQWLRKFFTEGNCLCHPSLMIRKECYDVLGLYDNRYRQLPDFDMWIRFCKKYRLHVMPDKLVKFRLLPEGQNASNQIKPNRIRNTNEFYFIMQRFFDDMSVDFFTDGFAEFVRNRDFQGFEEYECEKVFVYLDSKVPWAANCYRLIAFNKLYHLLSEETYRRVLQEKYAFDDKSFMTLSPSLEFLDSHIRDNFSNQYKTSSPFYMTDELSHSPDDGKKAIVELTSSLEDARKQLFLVYSSYPWKIGWAITSPIRRLKKILMTLRHTSGTLRQKIVSRVRSRQGISEPKGFDVVVKNGLIILDDIYPQHISAFRVAEFTHYLEAFENAVVYSTAMSFPFVKETRTLEEVVNEFEQGHPRLKNRIFKYDSHRLLNANLAYCIFLWNAFSFLDIVEKCRIPFIFTLYPGGTFALHEKRSDEMLKRVLSSPCFKKVIVTQKITYDYLIANNFCDKESIEFIYGGVFPSHKFDAHQLQKKYYGRDKGILDVCFVALKYMEKGINKGYDVFVDVAKMLCKRHDNIYFHVVGPFSGDDIDVSEIQDRIIFHGLLKSEAFAHFYSAMDIILSPNIPFAVSPGTFDGFPQGSSIEAGLNGVVPFITDPLNQNIKFRDGEDIVLIPHDAIKITELIEQYYQEPERLCTMSAKTRKAFWDVFSMEAQMKPRVDLLKKYIYGEHRQQ